MRLLILTQKVDKNDDVLGFFYFWIKEFAEHCQNIIVIALELGDYKELPKNVKVLSLGKENKNFKLFKKLKYIFRFYKYIWQERKSYDSVFVHMNPEYVVLGGLFWRVLSKKVGLWYTHKAVNLKLRLAEILAHIIFTASRESFCLTSKKVKVLGHGIKVSEFVRPKINSQKPEIQREEFKIITIGRISPIKDYETLIKAIEFLDKEFKRDDKRLLVEIIGRPITEKDNRYFLELQNIVKQKGLEKIIEFKGAVPNKEIVSYLSQADLFAHMSRTGSLDKAVLEAMAVGLPIISSNKAVINDVLDKELKDKLGYPEGNAKVMSERIKEIISLSLEEREKLGGKLRDIVKRDHSLEKLARNIIGVL